MWEIQKNRITYSVISSCEKYRHLYRMGYRQLFCNINSWHWMLVEMSQALRESCVIPSEASINVKFVSNSVKKALIVQFKSWFYNIRACCWPPANASFLFVFSFFVPKLSKDLKAKKSRTLKCHSQPKELKTQNTSWMMFIKTQYSSFVWSYLVKPVWCLETF